MAVKRWFHCGATGFWLAAIGLQLPAMAQVEDWSKIEPASRQEGRVLIYSTLRPGNLKPIIDGFNKHYPWIKVETLRVGSQNEAFDRQNAESSTGTRSADILLASSVDLWADMSAKGELIEFVPERINEMPAWAKAKGYFTFAVEPQVIVYNKLLLPQALWPKGLDNLAASVRANPAIFKGKISSYNPMVSPFSYSIYWSAMEHKGDAFWTALQSVGPNIKFEQTTGAIVEKIMTGEYVVGLYLPESLVPKLDVQRSRIMGISLPDDGVPMSPRSMGIMKKAQSPASAKLLINYLLSREGQIAISKGGVTAYWPGIEKEATVPTLETLQKQLKSERAIAQVQFSPEMTSRRAEFTVLRCANLVLRGVTTQAAGRITGQRILISHCDNANDV
jgi:iron(III) transport system substrate-binding protein